MRLVLTFLLPAAIGAQCLSPRNTGLCQDLMAAFSRRPEFSFYENALCFNFCSGQFQNTNAFFFASTLCQPAVSGCRLSDLPTVAPTTTTGSTAGATTTSTTHTTATSGTQLATNPVRWWYVGSNTQSGQILNANPSVTNPTIAATTTKVPGASLTGATVTVVSNTQVGQSTGQSTGVYSPQIGRGSITQTTVSGSLGTSTAVVTGAGKAIPFVPSTNIAGGSIGITRTCTGGKMGCGKSMSRSRSSVRSYETLAGEASSTAAPSTAAAVTAAAAASALYFVV